MNSAIQYLAKVICCLACAIHVSVAADNDVSAPYTVVTEIAPPLQFMNGNDIDGQTTRIVKQAFQAASLEAKFQVYPWARAFQMAQQENNLLIYPMVRTEEREDKFTWVGKLMTFNICIINIKGTSVVANTIDQLKGYKIGLMRNDYAHQMLDKHGFIEGQHYQLTSDISSVLDWLYAGKIDVMLADLELLKVMATVQGYDANQLNEVYRLPDQQVDVYLAANKNTPTHVINSLRQALKNITQ
ncbi:substrate-binding periplasmic protein [Thalassotalea euphylliae]|uniref:substrate-binding periplasmic protein n=1 Tax=Thalassotalea euphylliae TaxID=1655234 RepID=UPI00363FFD02